MDIGTGDTFESLDVFVSSIIVSNEEQILESTWGVQMTISNIHAHLLKKMCWEREGFSFVVPFDCYKVHLRQWWFALEKYLDTCTIFVYGGVITQVTESNELVNVKISEAANSARPRDWVVFGAGFRRSERLEQL
jgi:hypothetical protein